MKTKFNFVLFTLLLGTYFLFFISCSGDNENLSPKKELGQIRTPSNFEDSMALIINRTKLTEIISVVACRKPVLKKVFKDAAEAQFQAGYYEKESFFNLEKNKPRADLQGKSIAQTLIQYAPEYNVQATLDFVCLNDPGLAILVEGNLSSNQISDNVLVDDDFDDSNLANTVKGFMCGEIHNTTLSQIESSQHTILIVRESEAYALKYPGQAESINLGSVCGNNIVVYGDFFDDLTDTTGINATTRTIDCNGNVPDRDEINLRESIYKFRTVDDHDPGKGCGEFLVAALYGKDVRYNIDPVTGQLKIEGNPLTWVTKRFTKVNDDFKWKIVNSDLFTWNPDKSGTVYKTIWYEDDGGSKSIKPFELELSIEKVKVGLKVDIINWLTGGDDFIGEITIDYCNPFSLVYTPTSIGDTDVLFIEQ